jgi:hypothetical protein
MMSRPLAGDASWPESWLKDVASRGGDAGRPSPGASLSLSANTHLNVINNSCDRMDL